MQKLSAGKLLYKILLLIIFSFILPISSSYAAEDPKTTIYFTGIGCPHCAKVSPFLHEQIEGDSDFLLVEYEVYKGTGNAKVFYNYAETYGLSLGIPLMLYSKELSRAGDNPIIENFENDLNEVALGEILLEEESSSWETLKLNELNGTPKIYNKDRVALRIDPSLTLSDEHDVLIKRFLTEELSAVIDDLHGSSASSKMVETPGEELEYEHGVELDGWRLLWNGLPLTNANVSCEDVDGQSEQDPDCEQEISWIKVVGLAITDSINPCALSILIMMLVAIITYHPKDRKQILFSGLAFIAAVFITYIIYGVLIVKAFQLLQSISTIKTYLYNGVGGIAIILGLLEIKDFFFYKPGSIGTEMPLSFRPKVQKIIAKITSPAGAFGLGMFVTLFLLPCTVGPYIILGGILSVKTLLSSIPFLLLYNLIFVLPMAIIVVAVFFSTERIKDFDKWRKKNIKVIHLAIGLIFLVLGSLMLLGAI